MSVLKLYTKQCWFVPYLKNSHNWFHLQYIYIYMYNHNITTKSLLENHFFFQNCDLSLKMQSVVFQINRFSIFYSFRNSKKFPCIIFIKLIFNELDVLFVKKSPSLRNSLYFPKHFPKKNKTLLKYISAKFISGHN